MSESSPWRPMRPSRIRSGRHPRPRRPVNIDPLTRPMSRYGANAMTTSGRTTVGPLNARAASITVHHTIAQLAGAGVREQDVELIHAACVDQRYCQQPSVNRRLSALRSVEVPVNMYFGRLTPGRTWVLEEALTIRNGVEFDLVWRLPDGRIFVDELKVERMSLERQLALREQSVRQLNTANAIWGKRFAGLGVCALSLRYGSYGLTPDGAKQSWRDGREAPTA